MTINEYQRLAMTTLNPALDKRDVLINSVMGLCGESGEAIDMVKKHLHQGHAPVIHKHPLPLPGKRPPPPPRTTAPPQSRCAPPG